MTALTTCHARPGIRPTIPHRFEAAVRTFLAAATLLLVPAITVAQHVTSSRVSDDPFANGSWQLEMNGHAAIEAWNYNISHEEMYAGFAGLTYALRDGLALTAGAPLYYVAQRGVDGWLLGVTFGVRGRVYRRRAISVFLGFEVGASEADTFVPPRGTRFNYLALGSAGVTLRVRPGIHLLGAVKWVHVSNNSLAGRSRNPDIEAVGPQVGLLIGF